MAKKHKIAAGLPALRPTGWSDILLICRKCSKKLDGGFGAGSDETLRQALRQELRRTGQRGTVGLIEVPCFGVCPKRAVMLGRASTPGQLLMVPEGTPAGTLLL